MRVKLFWVFNPTAGKGWKAFAGPYHGDYAVEFEEQINSWLAENPDIEIRHIEQSASGSGSGAACWLISVWFTNSEM